MKKTILSTLFALVCAVFSLQAEVLSPYTEAFDNPTFRPKGWLQAAASSWGTGTYTVKESGGHSGGYVSVNQSGNYYNTYYNRYNYIDVLITPPVTGDVSIWVRKNGSDPTLTLYKVDNPSSISTSLPMLDGTTKNILADKTIDDWTQITIPGVAAGTMIGIRAHNLDIDDFQAQSANLSYSASILAEADNTTGSTTLEANAAGYVTVKFEVTLINNGDIDFPAAPSGGFDIELENRSLGKVVGTGSIDDAIPYGATVTKEFTMSFLGELAPDTKSNSFIVKISSEKTGSVEASLGYFTIIPYEPVATFMLGENNDQNHTSYSSVDITEPVNVGAGAAGISRTLWLWNSGTAPMKVTGTTVTGDFTTDVTSFVLARNEKKAVKVSLKGAPGLKEGSITFNIEGIDDKTYGLTGLVPADGVYSQDFEAETLPAGIIAGNSWKLTETPEELQPLGGSRSMYYQSTSYPDKFIMPKLTFSADEPFYFMATKTDNISSTLRVYTSPDRMTWTEVLYIDTDNEDLSERFATDKPTGTGYGRYEYRTFSVLMPAGDTYVAFEAGGARVDNIFGGKLVPVDHDIYVTSVSIPDGANVNTRYITSLTAQNVLATSEKNYDMVLEIDGKEVARAAQTPEMKSYESMTYDIRYTPHETGEYKAAIVFVSGDYRQILKEWTVTVEPELAEAEYQVGNQKITTTEPFNMWYDGTQSQVIYRAEDLGMATGVKIIGFTFTGYSDYMVKKHIKVWAQNTTDTRYDENDIRPVAKEDMTLVYDGEYTINPAGDNNNYEPLMTINFNTPVEYEGNNLRFMFDIRNVEGGTENLHVFFTVDNSAYNWYTGTKEDRVIRQTKDYAEDLDENPSWSVYTVGFPVTYFKVAKEVVVVHGNLTNDFDAPVAGALVKFESDDLLYSTRSDADGNYSISVGNLDHVFTLGVEADGYLPMKVSNITLDPKESTEFLHNFKLLFTDREATLSGRIINTYEDYAPLVGANVILTKDGVKAEGMTDEEGKYSVTVADYMGDYDMQVVMNGETVYTGTYTFTGKTGVLDLRVGYDSIGGITADGGDVKVSVVGGSVIVAAPQGMNVALYTASGILCGSKVSDGGDVEFGPLASGIYIVAGHKVVVR